MRRPRAVRQHEMPSLATIDGGGVTSALGFTASGVRAGFYEGDDRLDCALVSADIPCPCAALFTHNAFSAAPVDVSRDHLRRVSFGFVRAVLINSGNANALTGENGLEAGGFHGNHGLAPSRRAVRARRSACVQAGVARRRTRESTARWKVISVTVEMVEIFLQILILLAFGFLFSKRGIITESMKNGLSTLLLKAVLPLVILSSSQVAFDGSVLQGFVVTMAVSLVFYVVVVGGLGLVRKRIPIPDGGNRIFVLLCAYGNDGFIGIPLAMQFFGSSGMLYAIAANIVFNITLFSFGIAVLQDKAKPDIKGILLNPCLICTVVALVLYALPFRFPTPIADAFNMAGSMMTPLAMFIIGYEMSRMKLSDVVRDKWAYIVSFMRLLALPALAAVVLSFVPGIDPLVASVSVFLLAMPCGTLNVILSQQYGANPKFAARATTQSMFLFLLTVPLILILVKVLF